MSRNAAAYSDLYLESAPAPLKVSAIAVTVSGGVVSTPTSSGPFKAGETVTWKNYDLTDHTVTAQVKPALPDAQDKPMFDSGPLKPGETFQFTFPKEGTFEYYCQMHKGMTGTVVVKSAK